MVTKYYCTFKSLPNLHVTFNFHCYHLGLSKSYTFVKLYVRISSGVKVFMKSLLFISLHRKATKNQLLNTKYQPKFFCCCRNSQKEMAKLFYFQIVRRFFYNDKVEIAKDIHFQMWKVLTFNVKNILPFWWGKFNEN